MRAHLLAACAALALAAPAAAAPADDLRQLIEDHYAWLLRENPVQATALMTPGSMIPAWRRRTAAPRKPRPFSTG